MIKTRKEPLIPAERRQMENDPAYASEKKSWQNNQLSAELKELFLRSDSDNNGKLDEKELGFFVNGV